MANAFLRTYAALPRHFAEQYTALLRWSTPATHTVSQTGQTRCPAPPRSAAARRRIRRARRHCLARHAAEQYTALGAAPGSNGESQTGQQR
ncbi:hypothetical protein [Streptomyces sp. NPDC093568]|uniref:hypothetical protein n=1 Tax=Streptomyces sp. NPDC093568 TaxID=3366041 RepID=UPI00382B4C9B